MRIELIWAYRGRQVIVRENGRFVAEGLLNEVDLVSVPVPPNDGEGWRTEQALVLVVNGEAHRVTFGANVVLQA